MPTFLFKNKLDLLSRMDTHHFFDGENVFIPTHTLTPSGRVEATSECQVDKYPAGGMKLDSSQRMFFVTNGGRDHSRFRSI